MNVFSFIPDSWIGTEISPEIVFYCYIGMASPLIVFVIAGLWLGPGLLTARFKNGEELSGSLILITLIFIVFGCSIIVSTAEKLGETGILEKGHIIWLISIVVSWTIAIITDIIYWTKCSKNKAE